MSWLGRAARDRRSLFGLDGGAGMSSSSREELGALVMADYLGLKIEMQGVANAQARSIFVCECRVVWLRT